MVHLFSVTAIQLRQVMCLREDRWQIKDWIQTYPDLALGAAWLFLEFLSYLHSGAQRLGYIYTAHTNKACAHGCAHTDTQTRRHTDTHIHRHADTQTHRHTDTHTHTQHTHTQHTHTHNTHTHNTHTQHTHTTHTHTKQASKQTNKQAVDPSLIAKPRHYAKLKPLRAIRSYK